MEQLFMNEKDEDTKTGFHPGYIKFRELVAELKKISTIGGPLVFVCTSAFIEYLAKLAAGQDKKGQGYKDFITTWMSQVRPEYRNFKYLNGKTDLPVQMYHVLRCGIVHSFSLIPDEIAVRHDGRDRSIVLLHRKESLERGIPHLSNYPPDKIPDAAAFVAEDFIDDIEAVVGLLFKEAESNSTLKTNMETWLTKHPLISGDF